MTTTPHARGPRRLSYGWYAGGAALFALGLAGYAWYDHRYPHWREEVRLSDGRTIWIEQRHDYRDHYGTSQSWVTFSIPETNGEVTWHSDLTPQRVDVHQGKVYVFGAPRGEMQFGFYKNPRHYMVAFKWTGSAFERIPFLDLPPIVRHQENVYPCVPRMVDRPLYLTTKDRRWCPLRGDRWKFGKEIKLEDYEALSSFYAKLKNAVNFSE